MKSFAPALFLLALAAPPDGAADGVPPPWTPLQGDGDRILCWGREHRIEGPLPRQIVSQGEAILAGPVAFRFEGEPAPAWKADAPTRGPRAAQWASRATRGEGTLTARTTVEYDGFWDVEVDLGKGTFAGLALEIPLAGTHARFLHFVNETHYAEKNTIALPAGDGEVWSNRFNCGVWLGDDAVGLQWVADTDAPFRLEKPGRAITISRAGATTTLRITLLDHAVTLSEPLRWRFGLIATPVRPMAPRWRDRRLAPGASANVQICWWPEWTATHADTDPKDPRALAARSEALRKQGQYLLPYVSFLTFTERSAAYRNGGVPWRKEPLWTMQDEGTPYWVMCPNTPWAGFFPEQMEKLFRETGVTGLYYDFVFPPACQAAGHGCGYVDAQGVRRPQLHVFAMRRLVRETYERVKAVRPDSLLLLHASDALMYPWLGFGDLMLMGEEKRGPLGGAGGHYMDVLPLEEMRAEYRGHHAGLASFLIPEFATPEGLPDPDAAVAPGPTNEMLALALLHDVGVWPIYCHAESVEKVRAAQRDFGTADAGFAPYWEGKAPVELSGTSLLASAWEKGKSALVVIVNRDDRDVETRAKFRGPATDALTTAPIADKLTVPARGFRLVCVR